MKFKILPFSRIDIFEFFEIISNIKPIFYWLHSHVPAKDANKYFHYIQYIIGGYSYLFSNVTEKLISGTETTLKILISITNNREKNELDYIKLKMLYIIPCFTEYLNLPSSKMRYYLNLSYESIEIMDIRNFFYDLKK